MPAPMAGYSCRCVESPNGYAATFDPGEKSRSACFVTLIPFAGDADLAWAGPVSKSAFEAAVTVNIDGKAFIQTEARSPPSSRLTPPLTYPNPANTT
jgi:hypothetical protein